MTEPEKIAGGILGRLTPAAAGIGAAVGTYAGVSALDEVPPWVQEMIKTKSLDYTLAVIVIAMLFYFMRWIVRAFEASAATARQQAVAAQLQASASEKLAAAVERIANEGSALRDSMVEVSLNQGVIASRTGRLEEKMDGISEQLTRLLERAGEGLGDKLDRLVKKLEGESAGG
jgi:methyl-accepting chemotaxis protein